MNVSFEELIARIPEDELDAIVHDPVRWAEMFLIEPIRLEPLKCNYIQRTILSSKRRLNAIRVHRRGGKSYTLAILALYYAMTIGKCEILVIGPDATKVKEIFQRVRQFLDATPWLKCYKKIDNRSMPAEMTFTNGSRIYGFTTGSKQKDGAKGTRGQGADVVLVDEAFLLQDDDWTSLTPIFQGDRYRRKRPRVYVSSTPGLAHGNYYDLFFDPKKQKLWNPIHVSLVDNPDYAGDPEFIAECRAMAPNELAWASEYLAEFPDVGQGVFPRSMLEAAQRPFQYSFVLDKVSELRRLGEKVPSRTMGVDWDKHNADGHGCNLVVLEACAGNRFRLIYREEVPQGEFTLHHAKNRVIALNEIFEPEVIFIDRGCHGEPILEELQLYGRQDRTSGLSDKVEGIQFAQLIDCPLPRGGTERRRFKQEMVGLLRTWFEKSAIEISAVDADLFRQFAEYHVVSHTDTTIKYSGKNDHLVASLGLAAMAMHLRVKNPYAPPRASRSYLLPPPQTGPPNLTPDHRRRITPTATGFIQFDPGARARRTFSRTTLGNSSPGGRRTF